MAGWTQRQTADQEATVAAAQDLEALVDQWLTVPEVAELLSVDVTRIRQFLREGRLLAVRTAEGGPLRVPATFVQDGQVVKGLTGTITLLRDNKYADDEAIRWLFTPDDSLPGSPVQALVENRGTEVKRRAQALVF
jgi:excisionase family DNA binding protein